MTGWIKIIKNKKNNKKNKTKAVSYLEEDLQLLGLCVLQDLRLQVFEDGHTHVHLVVGAHQHTGGQVVADLPPVQVVPETLCQPLEAHLWEESGGGRGGGGDWRMKMSQRMCLSELSCGQVSVTSLSPTETWVPVHHCG